MSILKSLIKKFFHIFLMRPFFIHGEDETSKL